MLYKGVVCLSFFAGLLDWVENAVELFYIKDPSSFSIALFFLYSVFAVVKWLAVAIVVVHIVILLAKKTSELNEVVKKGGEICGLVHSSVREGANQIIHGFPVN